MVLALGRHDEMKENAVDGYHGRENEQEFDQLADIVLGALAFEEVADQDGVVLHGGDIPFIGPTGAGFSYALFSELSRRKTDSFSYELR